MPYVSKLHCAPASRRGVALLAVAPAFVVIVVLLVAFVGLTVDSSRWTERRIDRFSVRAGADTATTLAVETLWTEFEAAAEGASNPMQALRTFLDGLGIANQAAETLPSDVELLPRLDLASDMHGEAVVDGTVIESVRVRRIDEPQATRLEFSTTAVARRGDARFDAASTRLTVQDVFVIEAPPFEGLDFVLLANNINCILCHAEIDNVERVYNADAAQRGTFRRVRVGSLESLEMRSNPESSIAGTLYVGGAARDTRGNPITDWSRISLSGRALDDEGRLLEHFDGSLTPVPLVAADPTDPQPFANLYLDYFGHNGDPASHQVDGPMPTSFPLPFPDDGGTDPVTHAPTPEGAGDRLVDDNEFAAVIAAAQGHASGGHITVVPRGSSVPTSRTATALLAGSEALAGFADGHVVMHGTAANPIRLSGDIAIAGDLILSGVIEGSGNLQVKGNVFIAGDVVYNDAVVGGVREFGKSSNGSDNLLTIAMGKNVMIGDVTRAGRRESTPTSGFEGGGWNFTMDELAIFNNKEWMKSQPTLPGEPVYELVARRGERRELFRTVEVRTEEPILTWQGTGNFVTEPVYEQQGTGEYETIPIMERQQIGTRQVPIYETVHHPADPPEPYGAPWTEQVLVGHREEPVFGDVQVGTRSVEITRTVQVGTREVEVMGWVQTGTNVVVTSEQRSYDPPRYETFARDLYEWVTPQHPNPYYMGPDFRPRYYAMAEGAPAPIFNKVGHYDPALRSWVGPERPGGWDSRKLTLADPTNPRDPLLFDASGAPRGVITSLAPTEGWISPDQLRSIIALNYGRRDASTPLAVDAWLYSSNSIFGLIPKSDAPGVDGRMRVNGAIIAPDIGLLSPGSMELNFDRRGRNQIKVRSTSRLSIQRRLWAAGDNQRRGAVIATLPR